MRDTGCGEDGRARARMRERERGGEWLVHQPQPGWLAARGNCRAMFIATQFVKPTLNGNNVPLSASFLSLPRFPSRLPPPTLSLSFSPFVAETEVFTFEATAPTHVPHICVPRGSLQLHLSSAVWELSVVAALPADLLSIFVIN